MKLTNTTDWDDNFLRRMVSWCCRQAGLSPRDVRRASFGNRTEAAYSGRAWGSMRIHVAIGPDGFFPRAGSIYAGRTSEAYRAPDMQDRIEALIAVTAHELTHLHEFKAGSRNGERYTRFEERRILDLFRQRREELLAEWSDLDCERRQAANTGGAA